MFTERPGHITDLPGRADATDSPARAAPVTPARTAGAALLAVGGCHRDVVGRTTGPFEPGTSCPGRVVEISGGVARNVAVLAASAGLAVALLSRVGADAAGRSLVADLRDRGIDTRLVEEDPSATTGTYLAVHDDAGELVAAVSDLAIYDRIGPDVVDAAAAAVGSADRVFADANLPAATLDALAAASADRLAVDAISRAKAPRIAGAMGRGALVFVNRTSAECLAGRALASAADAARALRDLGATRAVVTAGANPLAVLDDGAVLERAVPPTPVADVTGAGDALIAGTLLSLSLGRPLMDAVGGGIAAARAALACRGALAALPPEIAAAIRAGADDRGGSP